MILIIGANEIGVNVARKLKKTGFDVLLLEENEKLAKKVSGEHHISILTGDATRPPVLKEAGVDKADAVIALTSSDRKNLMICMFAKKLGAREIIAKTNRSENIMMFKELGIDVIICPSVALSHLFETAVYGYTTIGRKEFDTIFIDVPEQYKGAEISYFESEKTHVASVLRDGKIVTPCTDTGILPGDTMVLVGDRDACRKLAFGILEDN